MYVCMYERTIGHPPTLLTHALRSAKRVPSGISHAISPMHVCMYVRMYVCTYTCINDNIHRSVQTCVILNYPQPPVARFLPKVSLSSIILPTYLPTYLPGPNLNSQKSSNREAPSYPPKTHIECFHTTATWQNLWPG